MITRLLLLLLLFVFQLSDSQAGIFVEEPSGQKKLIVFVHGLGNDGGKDPLMAWSGSTSKKSWPVPSGKWLEFAWAHSPGNMKVSFQAARSIG